MLTATRDLAREMRNKFSRSQSQSEEDPDLKEADPLFSSPNDRWLLPGSEGQYRKAIGRVGGYLQRLAKNDPNGAQFQARADNLADYLDVVSTRLGSLSQRLCQSRVILHHLGEHIERCHQLAVILGELVRRHQGQRRLASVK